MSTRPRKEATKSWTAVLETPDGGYIVVGGRLWRKTNPYRFWPALNLEHGKEKRD